MATTKIRNRPQRPDRTIITAEPFDVTKAPFNEQFAAAISPDSGSTESTEIQPCDLVAAVEPEGISLFLPLPVEIPTDGYVKRLGFNNIDCRLTDKDHKEAFQRLYYSLNQNDVRLSCGKHIDNPSDVIKHILELYTLATSGS